MEVICLEEGAFYALIEEVVNRLNETNKKKDERWITGEEAMKKLHITSKTTLQKLRNTGAIRFSQPEKKIILYDIYSIEAYLTKHSRDTF